MFGGYQRLPENDPKYKEILGWIDSQRFVELLDWVYNVAKTLFSLLILLVLTASCFADGSGSGFIVPKEGYVVTNHHEIEDAKEIWVQVPGKMIDFRASVVIDDSVHDLTLLKIQDSSNTVFDALQISDSEPHVMDDIFVFGYPFGDMLGKEMSACMVY